MRTSKVVYISILFVFIVSILLLGGCKKKGGVIKLYTSMPLKIVEDLAKNFETEYPDITVEIVRESSSKLDGRIKVEAESPQGLQADLIWAAAPSSYFGWIDKGLIQTYNSPEGKKMESKFKDEDNMYYGGRLISVVIVYNKDLLPKELAPQTWQDLMSDEWKGKIVMADARRAGTSLPWVYGLSQKYGWEFFQALRDNEVKIEPTNSPTVQKVINGEVPIGITLDYMARNAMKQGAPLGIIYPKDGAVIIPSPIAITSTTKRLEAAQHFVDFVLSESGQEILVKDGGFIPVRDDVQYPFNVNPAVTQTDIPINWKIVYKNEIQLKRNYKKYIID